MILTVILGYTESYPWCDVMGYVSKYSWRKYER
jgi:hypothetical protein